MSGEQQYICKDCGYEWETEPEMSPDQTECEKCFPNAMTERNYKTKRAQKFKEQFFWAELNHRIYTEKYPISWCDLCVAAVITCPVCFNSSCNGGGCNQCVEDFHEFNNRKTRIQDYLNESEKQIYDKCLRIQKFILETIKDRSEIDWKELRETGKMSKNDKEVFKDELLIADLL